MLRSVRAMCEATHCFQQQFGVRCNYPSASLGTRLPFSRNLVLPGSSSGAGDEGEEDGFEPGRQLGAGQGRLAWTRPGSRAQLSRRRSLSPLERVSSLIPQEMLSQEVMDLQQINQEPGPKGYTGASVPSAPTGWQAAPGCSWHLPQEEDHGWEDTACQPNPPDREVPFKPGDVVLVEFRRRHCLELQKMFNLVKDGKLHMGSSGHVYSFEVRPDHHSNAKRNYQRWRNAWEVAHEKEWPNNVEFINKDIVTATDDIQGKMFDAVALDMLSPQLALPVVYKHLKQGGVCAVYLANITQVVDLLEGIRSCQLFFSCEKISEVIHRSWLVAPALRKDGSTAPRVKPQNNVHSESEDEQRKDGTKVLEDNDEEEDTKPFCTIPYIARPHHEQVSHTAFLVKLRKFRPAQLYSTPHKSENSSLGL
ncbi:tRNA (adenine(58)-N(1))-methyltransferase, mitochondrial isoform X2 [Hemiscyllium ocellatum]|uniref:tRNA (adenine(58)-N(1))-methyltransferase, mitochondrial isoform X2 n=1 Tax=Hemiscyllium ocellatum TaxID=170820 RepID=UPI00296686F3|nr:tRNA (adenine(58)-N(1))-methyltransferase, mitochondrial isoform X2 [Hemiscyllium ocellatum]